MMTIVNRHMVVGSRDRCYHFCYYKLHLLLHNLTYFIFLGLFIDYHLFIMNIQYCNTWYNNIFYQTFVFHVIGENDTK